ncbi:MAG: MFS transporter [Lachnospiraceae bacterium]|nr:MFS transporter [Lachnospiraceae bacterium]
MKKNIYIMYVVSFLHGMVFYASISTLYRQTQGLSILQITMLESISMVLSFLFEIPWGILADRIGYKRTMVFCCWLFFISKIVFWQATGFVWFLAERIMISVVFSGLSGVDTAILYLSSEKGKSQQIFGIYNSLGTAGLIFSSAVFACFMGDDYKLAALYTVISHGIAAIAVLGLDEVKAVEKSQTISRNFIHTVRQCFADKRLLLLLLGVAFLSETHQMIITFLNQLQYERCGMSSSTIGFVYILVTLAGLNGAFSMQLSNKTGESRMAIILCTCALISCVILAITSNALLSVVSVMLLELTNCLFSPLQNEWQNRRIKSADRATALSVNTMFMDSAGAIIYLAFGKIAEYSLNFSFLFGAALCLVSLILIHNNTEKPINKNNKGIH